MTLPNPPENEDSQEDPRERFKRLLASEDETLPDLPVDPDTDINADPDDWWRTRAGAAPDSEPAAPVDEVPATQTPPAPPPPQSTQPPRHSVPAVDQNGMPLPRRVNETDLDGTRVSPAAYSPSSTTPPRPLPASPRQPIQYKQRPTRSSDLRRGLGCLLRIAILVVFGMVLTGLLLGTWGLYQYYRIASALPDVGELRERASQFETTRILDRNGNLLYEILDPTAGRRTYVPLGKISPYLVAATIATEDKEFYSHPGFDPVALIRALWQNYTSGEIVSGASTITQQLARMLLLTDERFEQTYERKAREIILAAEITRRYSKDDILELYLNESYYGNLAYGVEAAAETYFDTTADKLTLSQASFLAGLPQSPSIYDVYTNREITLKRQETVLVLMFQDSQQKGCIYVSNSPQPVCIDAANAAVAAAEMRDYVFNAPEVKIKYPHWVQFVRSQLEAQFDAQIIYRSGFTVYTTIDPTLQDAAQQIVSQQVASLAAQNVTNGALVAIRPSTGEILAMVGSADFDNEAIDGQVNMADSPTRQPGSSIKPITYVAAFEKGWTPATLIWDVPTDFPPSGDPNDPRPPYIPVNYDGKFHGPVTVRTALANSFNIPAVKTLDFIGIYDDPETSQKDGMIGMAERLGITSFTRNDYGLALTLGGGDVSLYEMTGAFAVFANGGQRIPPVAISKIVDHNGELVFENQTRVGDQVIRPEHAYLISSILSDNEARAWMFGRNSVLALPFSAAAKTGTTNDFRDNWTMGYTPDLAVGVWVGNADYTPMQNTTGLSGAAPIWSQFMQFAVPQLTGGNPSPFIRPAGITEKIICAASGTEPSQWCNSQRLEIFALDQPPLGPGDDLWRKIKFDTWTGLEASAACADFIEEDAVMRVTDEWGRKWLQTGDGKNWLESNGYSRNVRFAPNRECRENDPRPKIEFSNLKDGQTIEEGQIEIFGLAAGDNFKSWKLEVGKGREPVQWETLVDDNRTPIASVAKLTELELTDENNGFITLRLTVFSTENEGYAERKITLEIRVPTPTPTPTLTPTSTPSPTPTPPPSFTPPPSNTPEPPTPTDTPPPTPTPSITPFPPSPTP